MQNNVLAQAIQLGLIAAGLLNVIASPEVYRSADRFQIETPVTAATALNNQTGFAPFQLFPVFIKPFDMTDLSDPNPLWVFTVPPEIQRIDIRIMPIDIDIILQYHFGNMIGKPFPRLRIAHIE